MHVSLRSVSGEAHSSRLQAFIKRYIEVVSAGTFSHASVSMNGVRSTVATGD